MNFWLSTALILIGTFLAFVSSFILFLLTRQMLKKQKNKALKENLMKELDFNGSFLKKYLNTLVSNLAYTYGNNSDLFPLPNLINYRSFVTKSFFKQGILHEKLELNDINKLNEIINEITVEHQNKLIDIIKGWERGRYNDHTIRCTLEFEMKIISQFIKDINRIKEKVKKMTFGS